MAFGLPLAALAAGLVGVAVGVSTPTLAGVVLEAQGDRVAFVEPGSLAWAEGIRAGQPVASRTPGSAPDGWVLITDDGESEHGLSERAALATARLGIVPAVAAVGLGSLGLVGASRRKRRAELLGATGLVLGWIPLAAIHDLDTGPLVGAAAAIAPSFWAARWVSVRAHWLLGLAIALDAACVAAAALGLAALPELDALRFDLTAGSAVAVAAVGTGLTPTALARRTQSLRAVDATVAVSVAVMVLAVQLVIAPPLWVTASAVVAGALAYGRVRSSLRAWLDQALYAEQRERASIEAAEQERARLSRELHDDPLQALTGVIIKLEDRPDTATERDTLRDVASQLRGIATALHPPVLDDLGLVPAVESLFSETGPVPVQLDIVNETGFRTEERPPYDVELATYRIIQEAATNAIRHSGCRRIVVRGQISPASVAIEVVDDGRGLAEREVEAALSEGHLGLASMRRRAEAIDAQLVHSGRPGEGTIVSLRWTS